MRSIGGVVTLILLLIVAVLLLAFANGANDNFKPVATLYGSQTLSCRAALALATVAQLAGSLASVFLAGALLRSFGGEGLVPDGVVANPLFLLSVGLGAAGTVLLATRLGLPISTTHALIGGLVGSGMAFAPTQLNWNGLGTGYLTPLLVSPFLAVAGAGAAYPIISTARRRLGIGARTCLCAGPEVRPVSMTAEGAAFVHVGGVRVAVADTAQCVRRYEGSFIGVSAQRIVDGLHVGSALALGFARGLNDTPKVLALLVAASWSGLPARISLLLVAVVMAVGGLLMSARVARTMGRRITEMNPGQGMLANVVGSALVIGASLAGSPVSTTHVSTGAIFGIGLWTGKADGKVVTEILLAWIATLPIAAILAYVVARTGGVML